MTRFCRLDGCQNEARERSSYCSEECGDRDRGMPLDAILNPERHVGGNQ